MVKSKPRAGKGKKISRPRAPRRKVRSTVMINTALQPFPQRQIVRMKYAQAFSLNIPNSVAVNTWTFNLNSIYDPDRTGVGHQPYGHDTLQTLYNRYRVIGCSWNISAMPLASGAYPIQFCALPSNEVETAPSNLSEWREKPRCKYMLQGQGAAIRKISGYSSIPSLTGRTKLQYMADDRYQAQFGASPQELAILNLGIGQAWDGTLGADVAVSINVEMTYLVEVFDPKVLSQS